MGAHLAHHVVFGGLWLFGSFGFNGKHFKQVRQEANRELFLFNIACSAKGAEVRQRQRICAAAHSGELKEAGGYDDPRLAMIVKDDADRIVCSIPF